VNGLAVVDDISYQSNFAMSHIADCLGSKYIVAINKDKQANIFNVAHFGFVGDYKEVLPALTAKLKELKSK
jgi:electron transfer flavoprotein alpha subunit